VRPSRGGRRGLLYTHDGPLRIAARAWERSEEPLDGACACEVCRTHSRAYLRHLFAVGDHTATSLGTLHNVSFFVTLLREARGAILDGTFDTFHADFLRRYRAGERAWRDVHDEDPHGARGSRLAREEREARRPRPRGS
jgi:queuine tRNA-ribosyltransferase